jgi:CHAT domain-containing protein
MLSSLAHSTDGVPTSAEIDSDQYDRSIRAAAAALDAVIDEIRRVPGYQRFLDRPTFADVAAATETCLVYLAAGRTEGLALLVRADDVTQVRLPELIASATRARCDALGAAQHAPHLPETVNEITQWLWRVAVEPMRLHLDDVQQVTLVPVGILAALPLHAAHGGDDADRHLLDLTVVRYAPNARALRESVAQAERIQPSRLLAVAEPAPVEGAALPFAHTEAMAAAAGFPASADLLAGEDATRVAVIEALDNVQVAHFACHGYAVSEEPTRSGVVLSHDETLTVGDLLEHGFVARLVVLSACQTAVPGAALPDEVIGLPTAMLQAGTAGVVASLWPVLDSRALLLMVSFYEQWRHLLRPPAEALQAAQMWMRDTSDGEKYEKFNDLLGGTDWLPPEPAQACWEALVLAEPNGRFFANPVGWAAFCYVGW